MNNPNWNDAPEWANYAAMDADGEWWWFENKPNPEGEEWKVDAGSVEPVAFSFKDWKDAMEKRP